MLAKSFRAKDSAKNSENKNEKGRQACPLKSSYSGPLQFTLRIRHIFSGLSELEREKKGTANLRSSRPPRPKDNRPNQYSSPAALQRWSVGTCLYISEIKSPPHHLSYPKGVDPHPRKPLRSHNFSESKKNQIS